MMFSELATKLMSCLSVFVTLLKVVLCYGSLASCATVSVAKPSALLAKYLDYEIGASIHFNMQTFNETMKPGKSINWPLFQCLAPSLQREVLKDKQSGGKLQSDR